MISTDMPAAVKWVVSKIQMLFGVYWAHSGKGRFFDRPGRGSARKRRSAGMKDPPHGGRGHPHPRQVGSAVGQFAVGPVDIAPLLEQRQDPAAPSGNTPCTADPPGTGQPTGHGPAWRTTGGYGPPRLPVPGRPGGSSSRHRGRRRSDREPVPLSWPHPPGVGPGHLAPTVFSSTSVNFTASSFAGLRQPRDLGFRSIQLVIALTAMHTRFGRRQRRQSTILGDRLIRMIVDRSTCWAAATSAIVASWRNQLQPDLVLQRRTQQPLERRFLDPLTGWFSRTYPDPPVVVGRPAECCLIDTPISIANSDANQGRRPRWGQERHDPLCRIVLGIARTRWMSSACSGWRSAA